MSTIFNRLWNAFRDKEYRQVYAESFSDSKIATQIKVLREQRGWTQQQLADAAGMKQSRIAALEDVNYSSWSIRTLRRLAQAFDLWLDVEFKEFGAVWLQLRDFSRESLARRSFVDDPIYKGGKAEQKQVIKPEAVKMATSPLTVTVSQERSVGSALSSLDIGQVWGQQGITGNLQSPTHHIEYLSVTHMALHNGNNYEYETPSRRHSALVATMPSLLE